MILRAVAILCVLLSASITDSAPRSSAQRDAFVRQTPCPSTGETRGRCPGFVVDHIDPLCAGGADHPDNMQWQALAGSYAKDVAERSRCRALRQNYANQPSSPENTAVEIPPLGTIKNPQ